MKLILIDINTDLVKAWEHYFADFPEVVIKFGDILAVAENTIVSPANSHGFMDGGIDDLYRQFFGDGVEKELQRLIAQRPEGLLPVGSGLFVRTRNPRIPYMISVPTMVIPQQVPASNCFFAMAALLKIAAQHKDVVKTLYCPGLASGVGRVAPQIAAEEMANAYRKWKKTIGK